MWVDVTTQAKLRNENNKQLTTNNPKNETENVNWRGRRSGNTEIDRRRWEAQTNNRPFAFNFF